MNGKSDVMAVYIVLVILHFCLDLSGIEVNLEFFSRYQRFIQL